MSKKISKQRNEDFIEHKKMLQEMLNAGDKNFTEWQLDFIERTLRYSSTYSEGVKEIIRDIYKKKM